MSRMYSETNASKIISNLKNAYPEFLIGKKVSINIRPRREEEYSETITIDWKNFLGTFSFSNGFSECHVHGFEDGNGGFLDIRIFDTLKLISVLPSPLELQKRVKRSKSGDMFTLIYPHEFQSALLYIENEDTKKEKDKKDKIKKLSKELADKRVAYDESIEKVNQWRTNKEKEIYSIEEQLYSLTGVPIDL